MQLQKKSHSHSTEGHRKFLGAGGVLKVRLLEAKYEAKLEFPGGSRAAKQKTFRGGKYGYFLELHIVHCIYIKDVFTSSDNDVCFSTVIKAVDPLRNAKLSNRAENQKRIKLYSLVSI